MFIIALPFLPLVWVLNLLRWRIHHSQTAATARDSSGLLRNEPLIIHGTNLVDHNEKQF